MKDFFDASKIDPNEYLELVDENDEVVGQALRKDIYEQGLSNFRIANIFIFNQHGEILLPTRSDNVPTHQNRYDFSCSEHVKSGETYKEAALRGLKEELNLSAAEEELEEIAHYAPPLTENFMKIFRLNITTVIKPNPAVVSNSHFYPVMEIKALLKKHRGKFRPDTAKVINLLL